jgi:hypothetical protein
MLPNKDGAFVEYWLVLALTRTPENYLTVYTTKRE